MLTTLFFFSTRDLAFVFRVSPCTLSTRRVKLYLIKMLCSLPNSSPRIWFLLFVLRGWPATFHAAQSVPLVRKKKWGRRAGIWVTFLHAVWYDKAAEPARAGAAQKPFAFYSRWEREREALWVTTGCLCALLSGPISIRGGTCALGHPLRVTVFFFFFGKHLDFFF